MGEELWEDMLKAEIEHSPTTALHYTVREERRERRKSERAALPNTPPLLLVSSYLSSPMSCVHTIQKHRTYTPASP